MTRITANYYDWPKKHLEWIDGDTLYQSIAFSWHLRDAERSARLHRGPVIAGGPAAYNLGAPWAEISYDCPVDILSKVNFYATFTTRGCPNKCQFCIVPKVEGEFRELENYPIRPIVCDNNLLASSRKHFDKMIDRFKVLNFVDFNQGLDARLFTAYHADRICKLKNPKVRFSFDHVSTESKVVDAIRLCLCKGIKKKQIGIYILFGFDDSPDNALYRFNLINSLGIKPNAMRYQPCDSRFKNEHVAPNWTKYELQRFSRYWNNLRYLGGIPFAEYHGGGTDSQLQPATRRWKMDKLTALAIDFDGTICYEDWPRIGAPVPVAKESLIELAGYGVTLYLATAREGPKLEEALFRLYNMEILSCFGGEISLKYHIVGVRANCNPLVSIAIFGDCRKLVLPRIDDADPFTPRRPDGAVDWPRVMDGLRPLVDPAWKEM